MDKNLLSVVFVFVFWQLLQPYFVEPEHVIRRYRLRALPHSCLRFVGSSEEHSCFCLHFWNFAHGSILLFGNEKGRSLNTWHCWPIKRHALKAVRTIERRTTLLLTLSHTDILNHFLVVDRVDFLAVVEWISVNKNVGRCQSHYKHQNCTKKQSF